MPRPGGLWVSAAGRRSGSTVSRHRTGTTRRRGGLPSRRRACRGIGGVLAFRSRELACQFGDKRWGLVTLIRVTKHDKGGGEGGAVLQVAEAEASLKESDFSLRAVVMPPCRIDPRRHQTDNDFGISRLNRLPCFLHPLADGAAVRRVAPDPPRPPLGAVAQTSRVNPPNSASSSANSLGSVGHSQLAEEKRTERLDRLR